MKTEHKLHSLLAATALLATLLPQPAARAQGTAFSYQGRLNTASGPAPL